MANNGPHGASRDKQQSQTMTKCCKRSPTPSKALASSWLQENGSNDTHALNHRHSVEIRRPVTKVVEIVGCQNQQWLRWPRE
jgi:hypothetical protein